MLTRLGLDFWRTGIRNRNQIAARYLRGNGLEIGALHNPQSVGTELNVRYVDRLTYDECCERYPELNPDQIVRPSVIDDGFMLASVASDSEDFLIANHVLEHAANPLGALLQWARVLRPGGVLFITLPIAAACFDRGRPLTSLQHLIEDHKLCAAGLKEHLKTRNREHYLEWVRISEPAIAAAEGADPAPSDDVQLIERAELMLEHEVEIHFHTFSEDSLRQLLDFFCRDRGSCVKVKEYVPSGGEIVSVLVKNPRH